MSPFKFIGRPFYRLKRGFPLSGFRRRFFYLCGSWKSPGCASFKVLAKVFSAVLEVLADKAYSVKPGSHGKLRIFNLWLFGGGALLCKGLVVHP